MALITWARRHATELAIAAAAAAIAWGFVFVTLHATPSMSFPLDDSYIYLTYAKQFGRAQPFTYWPGGGYSAGSTSVVWPMLLAPFWTLGARGHALVWVSYLWCAVLYGLTGLGVYRLAKRLAIAQGGTRDGGELAGAIAAGFALLVAPFAFAALSGMEVALASALLVGVIARLVDAPRDLPPGWGLGIMLAAASLARPEAMLIVVGICAIAAIDRVQRGHPGAAARWLVPLVAPAVWLVANEVFAGQLLPNTGVAKSHFYLPGFDWTYWWEAVRQRAGGAAMGLLWNGDSPLVVPRVASIAWLAGAIGIGARAWRQRRHRLAAACAIGSPIALVVAVLVSSGLWDMQNYRYIAPAFPLVAVPVGIAFAPLARAFKWWVWAIVIVGAFAAVAWPRLRDDMQLYAQGARDTNTQVVAVGRFVHDHLPPGARVMFHDAGAIAYYGDGPVIDMLGLVTNHQAGVANNGPGARFEMLESLPEAARPTHFAYYPSWLGTNEFWDTGEPLLTTRLEPPFATKPRLAGDRDMQVRVARWDHVGTGERPLRPHPGWAMVDRVDIADLASEAAHGWRGEQGRRAWGDPTAKWSFVARTTDERGLVLDGGRTIRGGRERFAIARDPAKPVHLVMRGGGDATIPYNETITKAVTITVTDTDTGALLATGILLAPHGRFDELELELPAGETTKIAIAATGPYRVFHYFVLQPQN